MQIETATIVSIAPTSIWIESDIMGSRHVVMQHEGCEPFTYATFHYDHRYTSNGVTWDAAEKMAIALGATEPIEHRHRHIPLPTAESIREEMGLMQKYLAQLDGEPT